MTTMRARLAATLLLSCLVTLAAGCAGRARVPPLVIGPVIGAPSPDSFERLQQSARMLGYEPQRADLTTGVFYVVAHHVDRGARHELVVQSFASGHVMVVPAGARVRHAGTQFVVPPALRDEMLLFVDGLAAGAGISQRPDVVDDPGRTSPGTRSPSSRGEPLRSR
jgi:hypothetical protein